MSDTTKHIVPLITVVTIAYNAADTIKKTIESVLSQTYPNVEYILIDGCSSDATMDIVCSYEDSIDVVVSEPDKGIADAMNKGLSIAHGQYVMFLHADDYFFTPEALNDLYVCGEGEDIVAGNVLLDNKGRRRLSVSRGFNFWMNFKTGIKHQATLCNARVFDSVGYFDTRYSIVMDYDFFLRAYKKGMSCKTTSTIVSVMGGEGISSQIDAQSLNERLQEERLVHANNAEGPLMLLVYRAWWLLYLPFKNLLAQSVEQK